MSHPRTSSASGGLGKPASAGHLIGVAVGIEDLADREAVRRAVVM